MIFLCEQQRRLVKKPRTAEEDGEQWNVEREFSFTLEHVCGHVMWQSPRVKVPLTPAFIAITTEAIINEVTEAPYPKFIITLLERGAARSWIRPIFKVKAMTPELHMI